MRKKKDLTMIQVKDIVRYRLKGYSQREIARQLGIGRTTIQDLLHRLEESRLSFEDVLRLSEEELYKRVRRRRGYQKREQESLDLERIDKELQQPHVTLELLHLEYKQEHPDGYCYSSFCAKYREWKNTKRVWMRNDYKAGSRVFIDYCGSYGEIVSKENGEIWKVPLFVGVLPVSFLVFAEATPTAELLYWIGAHVRMFDYFGGVPRAVSPDNVKTAVRKACRYDPLLNRTYQELSEHYNFDILPSRIRKPRDKAKVEKAVQMVQRWILAAMRNEHYYCLASLNVRIRELLTILNEKQLRAYKQSRRELFEELERTALQPLPYNKFQYREWKQVKVAPDYHVEYEKNRYSVHYIHTAERLWLRAAEHTIEVFKDSERIAAHRRLQGKHQFSTIKEHMPAAHKEVSRWDIPQLQQWADAIGVSTRIQIDKIIMSRKFPAHAIRPVLGLLSLSRKFGEQRLEQACEWANEHLIVGLRPIRTILDTDADLHHTSPTLQLNSKSNTHKNIRGSTYYH